LTKEERLMLIDEKGRIFGKINIIDLFVIVLILSVVPMYFMGHKVINAKIPVVIKEDIVVRVEARFDRVIPELAKVMAEGDAEKDDSGRTLGKLVKVISNEPSRVLTMNSTGVTEDKLQFVPDPDHRDIKALLELTVEDSGSIKYRGSVMKIGNPIIFTTDLYYVQGTVTDVKR